MKNIVLVGFMGTGKTVLAKALAKKTGRAYVSTDAIIEAREGIPINDIFGGKGESYFRKVEKEVVSEVSGKRDQVIDAGGGVVLDSDNMDSLRKNGVIICLWASPEEIHKRTARHGHRPLLNVADPEKRITELLEKRRPFYEEADFHVDTTGLDIEGALERIMDIADEEEKEAR